MKHFLRVFAFILTVTASSAGCCRTDPESEYLFTLVNDSGKTVGWYIPLPGEIFEDGLILPPYMPSSLKNSYRHILPGDEYQFLDYEVPSEYLPDDAVKLYIFTTETLAEYSWEQIREDNLYEDCFELTVEGLKNAGKRIVYKGN